MAARFAASLCLLAFGAICASGALRGDSFATVVERALAAMAIFGVVGAAIGVLARNAVRESVEREIREIEQQEAAQRGADEQQDTAEQEEGRRPETAAGWPPNAEPAEGVQT